MATSLALAGCATHSSSTKENHNKAGWACDVEDRSISRFMGGAVARLARGDDTDWSEVTRIWTAHRLDGIAATCFVVGLGELFARSPSIFLERYLSGDDTAKEMAREGYNLLYAAQVLRSSDFDADKARSNALRLYRQRQSFADEPTRRKIEVFIQFITTH